MVCCVDNNEMKRQLGLRLEDREEAREGRINCPAFALDIELKEQ